MNQYANLYDARRKAIIVAKAHHVSRVESQNPYVTALPEKRNEEELIIDCTRPPGLPPSDEFAKLTKDVQLDLLTKLETTRIYLPYYIFIETIIDRALTQSYERRTSIICKSPIEYTFKDKDKKTRHHCIINEIGDAPTGFALLGKSGCGKTTGLNNVIRKYPRVIIHNPGTMQQHIQIPILDVQMTENSNFHGLYQAIGRRLDRILENTNRNYENLLSKKGINLSVKFHILCNLIEVFHIGMLIIDEIELISTSKVKEGTLETIMTLANQTGIAIGVVGTEDAFAKLFYEQRINRRMGELITADDYCSHKSRTKSILYSLYNYLPGNIQLDEDCINAYYTASGGIIAYIIKIFTYVAKEVYEQIAKNETPKITPKLIHNITKKHLSSKLFLDKISIKNTVIEDEAYSNNTIRNLLGVNTEETTTNNTSIELPEICHTDRMYKKINDIVKSAIHAFTNNKYTEEKIDSALFKIMKKNPDVTLQEAISGTIIELKEAEKKEKKQKQALLNMQALKNNMIIADIQPKTTKE